MFNILIRQNRISPYCSLFHSLALLNPVSYERFESGFHAAHWPFPSSHRLIIGLLLLQLLHQQAPLLVLATLVLKPDPDHPGAEAGHLHQLFLHERVGPRIGVVAGPQCVKLFLV